MSLILQQGPDNLLPSVFNNQLLEIQSMEVNKGSISVSFGPGVSLLIDTLEDSSWLYTLSEDLDAPPIP